MKTQKTSSICSAVSMQYQHVTDRQTHVHRPIANTFGYFALVGEWSIVKSVPVCLSVCLNAYLRKHTSQLHQFWSTFYPHVRRSAFYTSPTQQRCSRTDILHVTPVTFLYISHKPHFDLERDCIIREPIKRRFQQYLVPTEIMSTFHTRAEYISRRTIRHSAHSNQWD